MSPEVRFTAVADSRFFVGAAALVNSLRLSGNEGRIYVFDRGLEPDQRARLEQAAQVLDLSTDLQGLHPMLTKTAGDSYWSDGILVLVDSDMIVTSRLDDLIEQAAMGKIAVYPDHESTRDRQFPEWADVFKLEAPLRRQRYVNAGLVAVSLDHNPAFLARWRRACLRLPADWAGKPVGPFAAGDQEALNAILMSEVPAESVWIGPDWKSVHADGLNAVQVVDSRTLECRYRGSAPVVLHYSLSPKAWERRAWSRIRPRDAYVRLLRRLLFARGVPVHAVRSEVPIWLWPRLGRAATAVVFALFAVGLLDLVRRVRDDTVDLASRLFGTIS